MDQLREHEIVGYVNDLIYATELRYLDELLPGLRPTLSSSSIQAQRGIIAAGGGIGVLPRFIAGKLTRVLPHVRIERTFWLSTHEGVHDTLRIRLVRAWLKEILVREGERLVFSGAGSGDAADQA